METAKDGKPEFSKAYLKFRPHANAILDLTFSPDDLLLATASGDQTAQVVDMPTQRPNHILAGHASSVKQVRFQPGSSSVLATSSRDGSVQIWDLRCKGLDGPVQSIKTSFEPGNGDTTRKSSSTSKVTWARPVNSIYFAHSNQTTALANSTATSKHGLTKDNPSKTESSSRRGDVSITALSFLHPGQEHLLLTASEADASVKLWDLRTTHNHRRHRATPLSTTCQPDSHSKHRKFGITSLALSGDGGRLYTLCRDNTIYTYATSHLILGQALELSSNTSRPRRSAAQEKEGIGPIYGFRHPNFRATTFYVKSALRPVADNKTELLAVGSSDGCVVLFPTDERYTQRKSPNEKNSSSDPSPFYQTPKRTSRCRIGSATGFSTRLDDTIPIHQYGSALIRGHSREVTGLTWTLGGDLVTVGDDLVARCWREGEQSEARDLRIGGEGEGRRWGCGWAKAESGWDDEDS